MVLLKNNAKKGEDFMIKKITALFTTAALVLMLAVGCGKKEKNVSIQVEDEYPWLNNAVEDTSDLPNWEGSELKLRYWTATGTSASAIVNMANDVVIPEIKRVTGITFDDTEMIDNAGQSFDVKLNMLMATGDYPDIVLNGDTSKLVEADLVYDLTDYIQKYAPTIWEKFSEKTWKSIDVTGNTDRIYGIPYGQGGNYWLNIEDFDYLKVGLGGTESRGFVYVRDDILKKLYPNAKTQDEIEELYLKNGEFSEDEIFDVTLKSFDDFVILLKGIKELNIKENGRPVLPTYGYSGSDNWDLLQKLCCWFEGRGDRNQYYTYWDRKSQKVELALKQDFFKNTLKKLNTLINEDLISKESLIETSDSFTEKLNNGLYAVTYGSKVPTDETLKKAGKNFRYRKVYIDIPFNKERFVPVKAATGGINTISVFKKTVSEDELIQILRWCDYMVSDTGAKLISWGPRSSGLWEEKDGKRVFINKAVERYVVYNEDNDEGKSYNLMNTTAGIAPSNHPCIFSFGWSNIGNTHPTYVYDKALDPADANKYFSSLNLNLEDMKETEMANITMFANTVELAKKAWGNRPEIESCILSVLASSEKNFEKNYKTLLSKLELNGWTQEMVDACDAYFKTYNSEYMKNLK